MNNYEIRNPKHLEFLSHLTQKNIRDLTYFAQSFYPKFLEVFAEQRQEALKGFVPCSDAANLAADEFDSLHHTAAAMLIVQQLIHMHAFQKDEIFPEESLPCPPQTPKIPNMVNTQYKKTLRSSLQTLGIELDNWLYFNDACCNRTTRRRIKARVSRKLSQVELGTLQADLGNRFGCKIDTKNYDYAGPCVVVYFRH